MYRFFAAVCLRRYRLGQPFTRAENAVETARRMLDKAVALKTVAWCTGLPLEQVERLRQESSAAEA